MNERITENITRDILKSLDYYDKKNIFVEEQKSQIEEVVKLLKTAGKAKRGGKGSPEFIISSPETPDFLVVIECKASAKYHESKDWNKPVQYAVDGVIHYARALSKGFNVIGIAVSGQKASSIKTSVLLIPKSSSEPKVLTTRKGKVVDKILPWADLIKYGTYDASVAKSRLRDLMEFSRELHEFMRDHAKLTESEKPLLVSGILIALRDKAFSKSFGEYSPKDLQKQWMHVIKEEMKKADIPNSKEYSMTQPYSSIAVHPELGKSTKKHPRGSLYELIRRLNKHVWPFISVYHDFDVVGQFYGEFLKYTGGDKKALGIVLTPRHITELFSALANIKPDDKVLDICAGTGAFLISAMHSMFKHAQTSEEQEEIRKNSLVGVEQQPNMYALAASNMILRGDGKANLYQGSCFDEGISEALLKHKCTVGMLNPPYSQNDEDLHELIFIKQMLDHLKKGGIGISIVPMSCVISPHPMKEELLRSHTLDAVMSMPDDLFYPVGTVTCVIVFKAHVPHELTDRKTWFGYWKNDGFVKTKHQGRIDLNSEWAQISKNWIEGYRDRDDVPGLSIKRKVTYEDEWCAEAYMKTDYTKISSSDYQATVSRFLTFILQNEAGVEP